MAKIPEYFRQGNNEELTIEKLYLIMQDMYEEIAKELNKKVEVYERTTDGQVDDTSLSIGTVNINSNTLKTEMLVAHPTQTTVTWKII
jgi:hypothetical protein